MYKYPEAFRLSYYQCLNPICEFGETYWNTRDGPIPSFPPCPRCGHRMKTLTWKEKDPAIPDYRPSSGQGVWIDFPKEFDRLRIRFGMRGAPALLVRWPGPEGFSCD